MLKIIGIAVLVLVLVAAVGISRQPDTFAFERSTVIATPASVPYAYVNDFHEWTKWSPYEKLDTTMTKNYGGAPAGVGATYAWNGNMQAGQGTMKIVESIPAERISIDLHFTKPMEANNLSTFMFEPVGTGTKVTWKMSGENTLMGKAIGMVMSMDKFLASDFEKGLASLKQVSEAR